ncbi:hypothetical protein [Deinococcus sp. QL22]|uniref:hypothetical protein n=1 Tax=Deinococcus sp. QL22 TaxID=2939437 RepID=UPI0020171F6C|nr:hypothetical protein [Deinococcus sp. QL22]UQN10126.1 hypothetical protein M1R55_28475 [Deinococcus sp. QL22]
MKALEEQRQDTLLALLQTPQLLPKSKATEDERFNRLVYLLVKAITSQSIFELQGLQHEAQHLRPCQFN